MIAIIQYGVYIERSRNIKYPKNCIYSLQYSVHGSLKNRYLYATVSEFNHLLLQMLII